MLLLRRLGAAPFTRTFASSRARFRPGYDESELQRIINTLNMGEKPSPAAGRSKGPEPNRPKPSTSDRVAPAGQGTAALTPPIQTSGLLATSGPIPTTANHTDTPDLRSLLADLGNTLKNNESAKASLAKVARAFNIATGYNEIETHKQSVAAMEQRTAECRTQVREAKAQYEAAIQQRADSQTEINELLTKKHEWLPRDVERFTQLYKSDHANQQNEARCKVALEEAELAAETAHAQLTALILSRYHEEQLWSDKIRQALTWGTWLLMALNIVLFATATLLVEPWKRRKLVRAFQNEVQLKLEASEARLAQLSEQIAALGSATPEWEQNFGTLAEEAVPVAAESLLLAKARLWAHLRQWWASTSAQMTAPAQTVVFEKTDLAVGSAVFLAFGWGIGWALATRG